MYLKSIKALASLMTISHFWAGCNKISHGPIADMSEPKIVPSANDVYRQLISLAQSQMQTGLELQ